MLTSAALVPGTRDRFQIPYELRIGVTGHRNLPDPRVEGAVRALLQHIIRVLDGAAADPLGPYGSRRSLVKKLDRALTICLAAGTRVVCPTFDRIADVVTKPLRRRPPPSWPPIPISPRRPLPCNRPH